MLEKASTASHNYAGRSSPPIRFPDVYSSFAAGAAQRLNYWPTMAKGFGWPPSGCRRGVSDGGRRATNQRGYCERIRHSYCWRPAIRRRRPAGMAPRERAKEVKTSKSACVPDSVSAKLTAYAGRVEVPWPSHYTGRHRFLRQFIAQHSGLSRRRLSAKVCEAWQWKQANGALCDMVCRGLMLMLHRAGEIELPRGPL